MTENIQYCKRPAANFHLAFTQGRRFRRGEKEYEMEVVQIGELYLPTGKIVASDPSDLESRIEEYFEREVPPGKYPVELAIRHPFPLGEPRNFARTACMRIRFCDEPIAEWIIATTHEQNPDDLLPFQIYGYGVDAGMGSFADTAGLVAAYQRYEDEGKDIFEDFYIGQLLPAIEAADWQNANILIDPTTGANLIVCSSGEGDGYYGSYWGLSAAGKTVSLVTDFGLLSQHIYAKYELGSLAELVGQKMTLKLPGGETHILVDTPDSQTLEIETSGAGATTAEIEILQGSPHFLVRGKSYSYGDGKHTIKTHCEGMVSEQTILVVSYLDHIEPV